MIHFQNFFNNIVWFDGLINNINIIFPCFCVHELRTKTLTFLGGFLTPNMTDIMTIKNTNHD